MRPERLDYPDGLLPLANLQYRIIDCYALEEVEGRENSLMETAKILISSI